jgi:hypothetical protein
MLIFIMEACSSAMKRVEMAILCKVGLLLELNCTQQISCRAIRVGLMMTISTESDAQDRKTSGTDKGYYFMLDSIYNVEESITSE